MVAGDVERVGILPLSLARVLASPGDRQGSVDIPSTFLHRKREEGVKMRRLQEVEKRGS